MTKKPTVKSTNIVSKQERSNPPNWKDYFYGIAKLVASKSKDDSQVGAVLVNEDNVIVSTGYNGLPRKVSDESSRISEDSEKYRWTVHAESNAICNAARLGVSTIGCTAYVTKFPCSRCAGELVQAGIKEVYSLGKVWKKDPSGDKGERSVTILQEAGIAFYSPEAAKMLCSDENRDDKSADEAA